MAVAGLTSRRVVFPADHADHTHDIEAHLGPFTKANNVNLDEKMQHARDLIMVEELDDDKFTSVQDSSRQRTPPLSKSSWLRASGTVDTSDLADYSSMYTKILAQSDAPLEWLREVLLCVAFAKRPLTVSELAAAMGVYGPANHRQTLGSISIASPKQLQDDLELGLGSLVLVESNLVRLVHGTLRELVREHPDTLFRTVTARTPKGGPAAFWAIAHVAQVPAHPFHPRDPRDG
jgi:hypothetical protein